jgi:hypothetical protein
MTTPPQSLKEKLTKETDVSNWQMLHHHYVRNSLFLISPHLDFIDTCVAIAKNNEGVVDAYIKEELIKRPDGYEVETWHKEKPLFKCLVISPFVFIQETDIKLKKDTNH